MEKILKFRMLLLFTLLMSFQSCSQSGKSQENGKSVEDFYTMDDFDKVEKYDTHVHISVDDTTFIEQAKKDNLKLLTVNVYSGPTSNIEEKQNVALRLIKKYPDRLAYLTAFSLEGWGTPDWESKTLAYLKNSFDSGAIGVKIWKNLGMELRDKDGKFVMVDDPRIDPIIDFIEKSDVTLLGHLGEPRNAWLPVDQMTVAGDKNYFSEHPQYHMYLHPEYPSYEDQINARDRMLEKHPKLRFVAAHLASLEWNVDELAKRLDKFPNIALDMAERICHLQFQAVKDWQKVHDFFIKYQDRLIYSTDNGVNAKSDFAKANERFHEVRLSDWKFFVTNEKMNVSHFEEPFNGLKLPKEVIDKLYRENARKWFPGIDRTGN
ncbi:MAG: amidohydrolase family protein [Bacteroidota bacterium]